MPALDQTLRDDDLFMLVLSGVGEGEYRNLPGKLFQVIYDEENPPKREDEAVEPHRLMKDRYFSDFTRRPTKSFGRAWLSLLGYGYVQSIGFRGYYRITSSLVRDAERIKKDQRVSDEDYAYLRNLGEKVRLVDD